MFDIPGPLGTFVNFLTIALGFGSIIFIHELGHFVVAKWAGIRVLAFSIGFGNVLCSYRKGMGFTKGSSESQYRKLMYGQSEDAHPEISPTEYRLSMLPLGGYVKMLGQEDLNVDATSDAPDSYQNCAVGKRMVVICAGVVMNMIMAAVLFIIVFMVGLKSLPAQIGFVPEDSPAANAIASNDQITGGLLRGDRIRSINSKAVYSFEDILPEVAMAPKNTPVSIMIEREGVDGTIEFLATPIKNEQSGLLGIGISPAINTTLKAAPEGTRPIWDMGSAQFGLDGLEPGDRIVSVNGQPISSPFDMIDIAKQTNGNTITIQVERLGTKILIEHTIEQVPALQVDLVQVGEQVQGTRHLLGLTGVLMVNPYATQEDTKQGLEPGDIFAKIANVQYPSMSEGIVAIRAHKGQSLDLVVLRKDDIGQYQRVKLTVEVTPKGTVGFYQATTATHTNLISKPGVFQRVNEKEDGKTESVELAASSLIEYPGSRITKVGDYPTRTLRDVHIGLLIAADMAYQEGNEAFEIPVTMQLPLPVQPDGSIPTTTADWSLTRADIDAVRELGWTLPGSTGLVTMFEYAQIIDKADGPIDAVSRGMNKSRRVMMQTYITFLRLFQGSVKVKHLKGPVGIAHLGTQIASQGWVWVLFFMALISINLAVINFLPLPIVDGGQFLMLVYEWIRGKPVPIVFQNVVTMGGLVMIVMMFLYVTFNDVKALFGL